MIKKIPYKGKEIRIEVLPIDPPPPAHHDTVPRYTITTTIWFRINRKEDKYDTTGWLYRKDASDLHLMAEIDVAAKEAKKEISKSEKPKTKAAKKLVDKTNNHIKQLTKKGFE